MVSQNKFEESHDAQDHPCAIGLTCYKRIAGGKEAGGRDNEGHPHSHTMGEERRDGTKEYPCNQTPLSHMREQDASSHACLASSKLDTRTGQ